VHLSTITIELNPREQRLYDRLRSRVSNGRGQRSDLRDALLFLPDFTVLIARLLRDTRVPRSEKLVALAGLAYVLSPLDLVPGLLLGPIGLVDDLLVASATLSRLVNHVHPDVVRSHWSGRGDALEVIQRITSWCEHFFRDQLRSLLRGVLRTRP
jgi:uncharacterized membrane protein YkvA (DUF1232 family)